MEQLDWKKSSYSNGSGGSNCAEVAFGPGGTVFMRDSKQNGQPDQPVLIFSSDEWSAFVGGAADGEFSF